MSSDTRPSKPPKQPPTILTKMKSGSNSLDTRDTNSRNGTISRNSSEDNNGNGNHSNNNGRNGSDGLRSRMEPRSTPRREAWVGRRDSQMSGSSLTFDGEAPAPRLRKGASVTSIASTIHATTSWGKRQKKKRDAEEYKAAKLRREKEEMRNFYKGTPMCDHDATSSELLRFLYDLWQPQLTSSYRKDAKISTNCRQDLRQAKLISKTLPRRQAKLHRARLVIDTCTRLGGNLSGMNYHPRPPETSREPFSRQNSRPESARSNMSLSRPASAKSVLTVL